MQATDDNYPIENHVKMPFEKLFLLSGAAKFLVTLMVIEIIHWRVYTFDGKKEHANCGIFSILKLDEYTNELYACSGRFLVRLPVTIQV